jgi:hypothetical protein
MRSTRPIDPPHEAHGQASVNQGIAISTTDNKNWGRLEYPRRFLGTKKNWERLEISPAVSYGQKKPRSYRTYSAAVSGGFRSEPS